MEYELRFCQEMNFKEQLQAKKLKLQLSEATKQY